MALLQQVGQLLSFGDAIRLLTRGAFIQRSGWNGKDMFLFLTPAVTASGNSMMFDEALPHAVKVYFLDKKIPMRFNSFISLKAADDTIVSGWLASQADILAKDWIQVDITDIETF